jgi:hypothetical protein
MWRRRSATYPAARAITLAECAVDGDLVQRALENGELRIIEAGHEILRDAAGVSRHGLREPGDAGIGERNDDAPSVGIGFGPTNQAFIDQPGDPTGHSRA